LAKLNIPDRFRAPLSALRKLSEENVSQIRSILDEVAPPQSASGETDMPADPGAAIATVVAAKRRTGISGIKQILEAVASLYEVKSQRDVTVEELVDDVCDAMETLDDPELRISHTERADFAGKLLTLLNADIFALVAKAFDLATEDERSFCHARILTDLRPIFGSNVEDGPKAMIVMHTLKLSYHEPSSGGHHDFYVSLDAGDLQALRKLIDRAEAKSKTLQPALKNIHLFGE
jgi:hypothetical protein